MRALTGGASSLTYAGTVGDRPVVVKVAPPGVQPTLHRDVLRQARVIRALAAHPFPSRKFSPRMPVIPPRFRRCFVMSFLPGGSLEPLFDPDGGSESNDVVSQRFRNAAVTMAQLHRIPPRSLGLESEPELGPVAEVERWCRLLETVDPALAPGWARRPATHCAPRTRRRSPPAVVHGDFRLGNLLAVGDRVTAVIDWEIWTVGDPRVDVGWFLVNADPATYRRATRYAGALPSPAELRRRSTRGARARGR